ncbi:hypothetical protein MNB_SUP05-SYMBIONT-7-211 [hydrothermal vent metagenome]|uniref:Uncharacterized protein n=1 Tax=hydrothermal vent metagenome TaxID=652676 RepID=A0A1W1E6A5_9ZZZZ
MPLLNNRLLHHPHTIPSLPLILRQKHITHRIPPFHHINTKQTLNLANKKPLRNIRQYPRTIPRIHLTTTPPPMIHACQHLQRIRRNTMRRPPLNMRNKTNPTTLLLVIRMIKTVRFRQM